LGGRVRVKVVRVNLDERKIDLELVDGGASKSAKPKDAKSQPPPAKKKKRRSR
jgi:ribonuclease R